MPPLTIDLGDDQSLVDERVAEGRYASAADVLKAALQALDREESAFDAMVKAKVGAALRDPRPPVPAADVFARFEERHAARMKAGGA